MAEWYALKDELLFKRAVGEIQLRFTLDYTLVRGKETIEWRGEGLWGEERECCMIYLVFFSPCHLSYGRQLAAAEQLISRPKSKYITTEEHLRLPVRGVGGR